MSHHGDHYAIEDYSLYPSPLQNPIPLAIGGNGSRLLRLAAQEADIVGFTGFVQREGGTRVHLTHFTVQGLDDRVRLVREAAGDRAAQLEFNALLQSVVHTDDVRATADRLAREVPGLATDEIVESPFLLLGNPRQMADALLERRRRFGISYFTVFEQAMEPLAPVIELLNADPA